MRKYSSLLVFFSFALLIQAQTFHDGQAARAVLGQTNFTAGNFNPNQYTLGGASGLAYYGGILYVADSNRVAATPNDSRILAFQTAEIPGLRDNLLNDGLTNNDCYLCGFGAYLSLGQSTFVPPAANTSCPSTTNPCFLTNRTQNGLANATGVATDGHYFAIADTDNNRVLLWNEVPTQMDQNADIVIGQTDFGSFKTPQVVDKFSLRGPQAVWIQNNHLFVADTQNNRVLIWNTIPTQNNQGADLVLGQNDFTHNYQPPPNNSNPMAAANELLNPTSVTSDGTHLYISDLGYNRVLIWNEIPTQNAQNADVVLGQPDMTQTAANNPNVCTNFVTGPLLLQCQTSLNYPRFALPVGNRLYVADSGNDRVLIFSLPAANGASAVGVLGEPDYQQDVVSSASISIASTAIDNTGGVDLLPTPQALAWDGSNLYVSDPYNRRVLVFTPADTVLPTNSVVNYASEIIRQEGIVQFSLTSGGTITPGDTVSVTVNGTAYTYTVVKGDTFGTIAQAVVKLINSAPDPNVTALYAGFDTTTNISALYLSSIQTDLPYDSISLTVTESNSANETVTASGAYLSAGTAATGAIGMLVEINGTNLSDNTAAATLDGVTVIPNTLGGVQVYMDGYACPILKVSPTQIVTQIPYPYLDRNSTSVYVRTVHNDGSVTVTNATAVYIAPANPGIFNAPAFAGQPRPWPIAQATHQSGNATVVIDFEGVPTLNNVATIVIGGTTYNYTVNSTDVASLTLNSIVQGLVNVINAAPDPNVTASVGASFNRVLLTARTPEPGGNGITVTATSTTSSTNTAVGDVTLTTYSPATCCEVTPGSPIQIGNPAAPGELINVTGVGLGLITDPTGVAQGSLGTGVPYNGPAGNSAQSFVTATMGGTTAQILDAYLPQGSYGTYIVRMVVPQGQATSNTTTLNIAQNAFISNTVSIPVGPAVLYEGQAPLAPATPITETIEAPSAGSTVSGTIIASGWALNSVANLTGVNVLIDGALQGSAIRYARPDVCGSYSSPDCPNTGWYLLIDTTTLADGQHTIAITALSTNGGDYTISQSFTTSNNSTPSTSGFNGTIEAPSANFTYRGTVGFSGWDTYGNAAVAGVSIYVDGAPQGAAIYGGVRNDVCSLYSSPSCPKVGWYFQLNTNLLANGTHTLTSKAISTDGHTYAVSQTFQVQNWAGGSSTTHAVIESPSAGAAPFSGILAVAGWAGDSSTSVTSIGVTVDGVSYGNASYGFSRTDVCSGFTLNNCPGVGFLASLDTTLLADGQHTLAIVINLAGAQSVTYTQLFNVSNENSTANPLQANIDAPSASSTVSGIFQASGWAISKADPVTTVSLKVDGSSFGNASYGSLRTDVCSTSAGGANCPNVGWYAQLNSALLGNGTHVLEVTFSTASGHRASTNGTFTVSNPTTGPGHVLIDSPSTMSSPFQGLALFSGSALNDNAAVSSVSITIDGVPYGSANYGTSRPDVCSTYPGRAGCPNVGWTFGIDTTQLTDGTHTLGVTENNVNGTFDTTSVSFTVANYSFGDPLKINIESPATPYGIFGVYTISGWTFSPNSLITAINVEVDGISIGSTTYGLPRTDVCSAFPGSPNCPNVGWYLNYNTQLLPNGSHTLSVTAITSTGQSTTVSETFLTAN